MTTLNVYNAEISKFQFLSSDDILYINPKHKSKLANNAFNLNVVYLRSSLPTYYNFKRLQRWEITNDVWKSTRKENITQNWHNDSQYFNHTLHLILVNLIHSLNLPLK